jgi:hypothetical protein
LKSQFRLFSIWFVVLARSFMCRQLSAKYSYSWFIPRVLFRSNHNPPPTAQQEGRKKDEGPQGATDDSQARPEGQQTLQLPVVLVPVEAVQVLPRHKEKVLLLLQVLSVATFTSPLRSCAGTQTVSRPMPVYNKLTSPIHTHVRHFALEFVGVP